MSTLGGIGVDNDNDPLTTPLARTYRRRRNACFAGFAIIGGLGLLGPIAYIASTDKPTLATQRYVEIRAGVNDCAGSGVTSGALEDCLADSQSRIHDLRLANPDIDREIVASDRQRTEGAAATLITLLLCVPSAMFASFKYWRYNYKLRDLDGTTRRHSDPPSYGTSSP